MRDVATCGGTLEPLRAYQIDALCERLNATPAPDGDAARDEALREYASEKMGPLLAAWLIDEMGMAPEVAGAGDVILRHDGPGGWYLWLTGSNSGGLPTETDWMVGAYSPADLEQPVFIHASDDSERPLLLRQAVGAACSIMANAESWEG